MHGPHYWTSLIFIDIYYSQQLYCENMQLFINACVSMWFSSQKCEWPIALGHEFGIQYSWEWEKWKIIPLFPVSPGFQHLELDMSLSCPGERDTTCGHWDHGISLFVCCNPNSTLCGMEIGRWISPFRR